MLRGKEDTVGVPSYREVLRAPVFLPVFLTSTLSTWGDYIARITVAAVVYAWTGSALATAATFAVSLVPSILGRALLSPLCDRIAPRTCLVATHLIRAALVGALVVAVATTRSVLLVLGLVFLLEFVGGPAITSSQMLLTDLFPDRRLFARAFGLTTLATQVNQAIGLALGGAVVGLVGESKALVIDLLTFLIGAIVLTVVVPPRSRLEPGEAQLASLAADLQRGWREIRASRVLTLLLVLSLSSALAMAAPEAVALPYASDHGGSPTWGGLLMAAPILGAVVGLLLIGRLPAERQSRLVMRLALLMPIPLLVTVFEPHLLVVWVTWFVCGALQSYMLPLQSAFTLLVPTALRGRVFGLAGALSVGVTGICFLVAGWISERTSPAASVGICAIVTFGVLVLLAARWPREEISAAVAETFRGDERDEPLVAEAAPPSLTAEVVAAPRSDTGDDLGDPFVSDLETDLETDPVGDAGAAEPAAGASHSTSRPKVSSTARASAQSSGASSGARTPPGG